MNDGDFRTEESPVLSASDLFCVFLADPKKERDKLVSCHRTRKAALAVERILNAEAIAEYGDPLTTKGVPLYYCCPADSGYLYRFAEQETALARERRLRFAQAGA